MKVRAPLIHLIPAFVCAAAWPRDGKDAGKGIRSAGRVLCVPGVWSWAQLCPHARHAANAGVPFFCGTLLRVHMHRRGVDGVRSLLMGAFRTHRGHTEDTQRTFRTHRGHTEDTQRTHRGHTEDTQRPGSRAPVGSCAPPPAACQLAHDARTYVQEPLPHRDFWLLLHFKMRVGVLFAPCHQLSVCCHMFQAASSTGALRASAF